MRLVGVTAKDAKSNSVSVGRGLCGLEKLYDWDNYGYCHVRIYWLEAVLVFFFFLSLGWLVGVLDWLG